jgi:hypothetical protein
MADFAADAAFSESALVLLGVHAVETGVDTVKLCLD